jgi:hypothetical protein
MSFVYKTELTSEHGKKVIEALAALGKNDPKAFYGKDAGFYDDKIVKLYGKMMDDKDADKEKVQILGDAMDNWLEVNEEKVNKIWEAYIEDESESEEESESCSECSGSSSSSGSKRSHNTPPLKEAFKKAKPSPKKTPKSDKKAPPKPPKKAPKPPKKAPKSPKSSKSSTSSSSTRKCSNCDQTGHNQVTCPNPTVWPSSDEE